MSAKKKKRLDTLQRKVMKVYYDPANPGSYGGVDRLRKATGLSLKKIQPILRRNLTYTLHKPVRRKYSTNPTFALSIDHQWAADLVDIKNLSKENKGFKYLLTVIDVLSKYAWVVPLKNKTGAEQKRGFESILKEGRKPIQLQTDKGSEFYNKTFQAFLKDQAIHHFSTQGETKASTVERFNRTLKERMYRAFTANNTLKYLWMLPDLVKSYNASVHGSIKMAPENVNMSNDEKVWKTLYKKKLSQRPVYKFLPGDKVRISKVKRTFKKGYLPGWTEEIFIIDRILNLPVPAYRIKEYDETPVEGAFYEPELQKVNIKEDDFFGIEKVLKRRGDKVLVQWKGWPSKYNSWIDRKQLVLPPS